MGFAACRGLTSSNASRQILHSLQSLAAATLGLTAVRALGRTPLALTCGGGFSRRCICMKGHTDVHYLATPRVTVPDDSHLAIHELTLLWLQLRHDCRLQLGTLPAPRNFTAHSAQGRMVLPCSSNDPYPPPPHPSHNVLHLHQKVIESSNSRP